MANEVFRRKEIKYILTQEQYKSLLHVINNHIEKDKYHNALVIIFAEQIEHKFKKSKILHWRQLVLIFEIIIL